ncbi:hypothetical protein C0991_006695 [Blastosporella zonata]|nr:hypothetical protein C0991_006695 [Blastosporella zonata]
MSVTAIANYTTRVVAEELTTVERQEALKFLDTSLVEKLIAGQYNKSVIDWADSLASSIKNGEFKDSAPGWISCSPTTSTDALQCPLIWAKESNGYDCSHVFNYANGTDLCDTSYYKNAIPIIESQIAKQGYRLAAWLNVLFDTTVKGPSKPGHEDDAAGRRDIKY